MVETEKGTGSVPVVGNPSPHDSGDRAGSAILKTVELSIREINALIAAVELTSGKPGHDFEALGEAACALLDAKDGKATSTRNVARAGAEEMTKADCFRVLEIYRDWNVDQVGNISGGHETVSILNNRRRLLRAATKRLADILDGIE
jgi:hypothetical protein